MTKIEENEDFNTNLIELQSKRNGLYFIYMKKGCIIYIQRLWVYYGLLCIYSEL
jgi:hypothetical protein